MTDSSGSSGPRGNGANGEHARRGIFRGWVNGLLKPRNGDGATRDALEEIIEERREEEVPLDEDERALVANVLDLRDRTADDVMVPRADIVAVEMGLPLSEVVEIMTHERHSRLPVFRETLDDVIGMVHIRDVLAWRGDDKDFTLAKIMRNVLVVAPSMQVLELLLEMRVKRCHMALVVDEFGGIDGLVTIEDLVEEIVGEIEDEHDRDPDGELIERDDGAWDADARVYVKTLEKLVGELVDQEEREDIDTLGGLVFALAGRVPIRGELITHPAGIEFEVLEADPRRVRRLRVRRNAVPEDSASEA